MYQMSRYLVFGSKIDEAEGGWNDLIEGCDTMTEVHECLLDWYSPETKWYHVVETSTMKIFMYG